MHLRETYGNLTGELVHEESLILLRCVLTSCLRTGQQIVVDVIVTTDNEEVQGFTESLLGTDGPQKLRELLLSLLEVLQLLVQRDTPNLQNTPIDHDESHDTVKMEEIDGVSCSAHTHIICTSAVENTTGRRSVI